jgi:response regulator RpfG family c-di-GMP phosphodiesterase
LRNIILIINDDVVAALIRNLLKTHYSCILCSSEEKLLDLYKEDPFDLILIDVALLKDFNVKNLKIKIPQLRIIVFAPFAFNSEEIDSPYIDGIVTDIFKKDILLKKLTEEFHPKRKKDSEKSY